jgi:D-alanyl-D-alanine dipeptidase
MGTDYDYFGIEAHTNNEEKLLKDGLINAEQLKNRRLLRKVMTKAGFSTIEYEWWHFNSVSREYAIKNYTLVE